MIRRKLPSPTATRYWVCIGPIPIGSVVVTEAQRLAMMTVAAVFRSPVSCKWLAKWIYFKERSS